MNRLKRFLRDKTIVQHLAMYFSIAVTVIALLLPLYFIACDNSERIIAQEQTQRVSQGFWELQAELQQCQKYAYNLACNTDIVRLSLSNDGDSNLPLYLYNLTLYQQNNFWDNDLVQDVLVQFTRNSTLLTDGSVYQDKSIFYDRFFSYEDLSYEQWQRRLFEEKTETLDVTGVVYNGNATQAFTVNYYYPSPTSPLIVVSFIIPSEQLLSALMTDEIRDFGSLRLTLGAADAPLSISHESGGGSEVELLELTSLWPRLTLRAGLSSGAYAHATSPIRWTLLIYVLLSFVAAMVLSMVFTRLNMRPLDAMISFISQLGIHAGEYRGNAYAYIRQALTGMVHSEEQMKKAYELTQTSLEHTVFNMAVKGLRVGSGHLECALGHIPAMTGPFVLVGVDREPLSGDWPENYDPDIAMVIARRLFLEKTCKPYLYESDRLYAVLNIQQQGGAEALYTLLDEISGRLADKVRAGICFGVSRECAGLDQLSQAADQAAYALTMARSGLFTRVVRYDRTVPVPSDQVPVNEEVLYQLLMQEAKESLEAYFGNLLGTVGCECHSPLWAKTIYYSVLAAFQRALAVLSGDGTVVLREYDPQQSVRSNMETLLETALHIQQAVCAHHHAQRQELIDGVLCYVQANYASPDLSLTMVADHFSLSERYLSFLIREQTGRCYSDYIIDIRMGEARRLLSQTGTPVNDVAGCVGYDRANSFYKSFKRCTGLSPRQYRTNMQRG